MKFKGKQSPVKAMAERYNDKEFVMSYNNRKIFSRQKAQQKSHTEDVIVDILSNDIEKTTSA